MIATAIYRIEEDLPAVPESAMYLYGTPSTSGNIGLRNGESVTLYDGAVLPELPETDLPYAVMAIQKLSDTWFVARLFLCAECPTCGYWYANAVAKGDDLKVSGEVVQYVLYNDIEINSMMTFNVSTANVWELMETKTYNAETQKLWDDSEAIWTNTDILYSGHRTEADGGVFLAKSDPVPVTGIVDYIGDIPIYEVIK